MRSDFIGLMRFDFSKAGPSYLRFFIEKRNTGKTLHLKTMKSSKGTIVSRKNIPCSIFGSHNQQHRERESANSMNENLQKRSERLLKKNRLVNDQKFQTKYYSNSYADQSNQREQTVDQWK
ncbi:hypothetical protein AVEN_191733-1 [Araneus ventricosus]|uniref:Uncharacterized protein n=1 Tax=Araneus ventricosus TaxID=182803 RepID=A0A4Y2W9W9_ARAVE|nr:hypothetical protein AVEN_191733-1 [Araneus ventricosus]